VNNKLFVGNLSFSTGEAELRQAFEAFGSISSVAVISDRMTGQSRGFGFVEYESASDAQRAIESLDGREIDGRAITVNVARERQATPRFGGGDDRGGGGGGGRGGGGGGGKARRGGGGTNRW
jgi:RNA recognition motif-containing protein